MDFNFRNLCAWFLAKALINFGFVKKAKMRALNGDYILSIYSHNPTKREFEACIKWLIKQKFNFLTINDLERIVNNEMQFPKSSVLLTVDDGWQPNEQNIVEIAAKYEVPVTIFVSTQAVEEGAYWWSYVNKSIKNNSKNRVATLKQLPNVERLAIVEKLKKYANIPREAMTVEQIKRISRSSVVTIGGHTHSHPILVNCEDAELYHEISFSKKKLEKWINKEVSYFAYPNGDYGQREVRALKEQGYRLAFSNVPTYLTKSQLTHKYEIPRIGLLEGASLAENICRMVGVWHPTVRSLKKIFKSSKDSIREPVYPTASNVHVKMS
ncbi:polysaccharide deacetylase family protein [Pontibacter sp. FD36]|nr:polysaccharide deacetylase family protein [Pontibacter sp. FD36]MBF8964692.1 polysaccharide deacetylase family protein [Pontibacter sp. FD36]